MLPAEVDSWARGSRATRRLALAGARRLPGASGGQGERASDGGERATHAGGVPIGREARTGVVLVWCEGLHSTYTPCVFRPGSRALTSPGWGQDGVERVAATHCTRWTETTLPSGGNRPMFLPSWSFWSAYLSHLLLRPPKSFEAKARRLCPTCQK